MRMVMLTSQPVHRAGSVFSECIGLLTQWGVQVEVVLPETLVEVTDIAAATDGVGSADLADLYVLKSVNDHVVGVASALEAAGARCLNTASVVRICRDRVATTGVLAAAGVPVPDSWTTTEPPALAALVEEGPLMLKPGRVGATVGHRVVWDTEDLSETTAPGVQWLAQRLEYTQDRDRKIYRIGHQVFGVKRRWPAVTVADKIGEPFTVTAQHHHICDAVARALGSDLFGLDLIETDQGPVVVDVHPFPGFKGVPNGALRLADYIYSALLE